ncbi:hypothetical protein AWJ24_17325, partial [Escherichia coli]|uniref:ESPR-type extended signal peptide-containing protein n=1 Tax=Escherichia coli TaxID=562 RepID=UPI00095BAD1A
MNKIFKVIWNPATGNYTVTSETAKSRGKKSGRSKLLISALVAGGLLSSFGALADNYDGQGVDYGDGSASDGWVAIGKGAKANIFLNNAGASTALGYDAIAEGQYSSAIGSKTHAIGGASMAFGVSAISEGDRSIALGASSYSFGQYSMALGRYSKALGRLSIAMGDSSKADGANAIALGNAAKAAGIMSIGLGDNANASQDYAMALGAESEAAENATAIGNKAHAKGVNSIALGNGSQALADSAIAIGQGNKANGADAIALGNGSQSSGLNAIALGKASVVTGDNSLALGSNTNANGINSVALDAGSIADQDDSVSVGSDSLQRKIVNVKNGTIKADSHDAINGSQLYAISDSVAKRLGGGSSVNVDDGTVKAPTYNLKNGNKNNVGDALTVLDQFTLQWDQSRDKYSAAHGSSTASVITDVADGAVSDSSKDAVNGSQLKATNDDVETNTTNIATNTGNIATNTANIATNTTNITNLTDTVGDLKDDALLWNGTAFNAAHGTETTSTITNVKAGTLSDDSTDAVNGSQLKATNDNVATNTTNIASNTANIATNTANINTLNTSIDTLEQDAILWNGTAYSAAHGTETASTITNVKAGTLSENSTDAVNGAQLNATNANVATNTTNIATNTASINTLNTSIDALEQDALLWDGTAFSAAHGANKDASKITNVLAGTVSSASTDAINGSQLHGLSSSIATYLGGGATVSDSGVFSGPTYNIDGNDYTNVGAALDAINTSLSDSLGDALLWDSTTGAFSAKHGSTASVITNVADGAVSDSSSDAVNGSQLYDVSNSVVDVLGGGAGVNTDGSISAPTYTIANTDYDNVGDALNALDTTLDDAMLWDATAGENGAFSASHDGSASKITNVAAGTISDTSTDAVNGAQLHGVSSSVAEALGGGAAVNSDGSISAPTYTIADTDYTNVGDAMNAIDSTLDNALLWDATAGENGAFNASHDGKASVITNVANGQINETSTDAVNGSQLNATNMLIQNIAGDTSESYITENGEGINYVRTNDSGLVFEDASATGVGATAVGYNSVASGDS